MRELEFESFEVSEPDGVEETSKQESVEPRSENQQVLAIAFSNKVINALTAKEKVFNKETPNKRVNIETLKKVYYDSAKATPSDVENLGLWAMAKVNFFLRLKAGEVKFSSLKSPKNVTSSLLDATTEWIPGEDDFIQAKKDIKEHDLNYNFTSIDDLYIEPYEQHALWEVL
jgi:hypothetical protein